jgi:hypothetical protein
MKNIKILLGNSAILEFIFCVLFRSEFSSLLTFLIQTF